MSNINFYQETFDQIGLSDEQMNDLLTLDTEKTPLKSTINRQKQFRYWAAVVAFVLLIPMVPTVYAGIHYKWFSLFFNNSLEYEADLQGLAEYANTDKTVTETDDFKLTIQGHLYSEEQQGGILICSLIFKNDHCYLPLNDVDDKALPTGRYVLGKDGKCAGLSEQLEGKDPICLEFYDSEGNQIKGWAVPSYKGELAEDGGYLIGIRYGEKVDSTSNTMMVSDVEYGTPGAGTVRKVAYTVKALAKCNLPKAGKLPTVTYTNDEWDIILSPIGVYLKGFNVWDQDSKLARAGVDVSNLDFFICFLGDEDGIGTLKLPDIKEGNGGGIYTYMGASEDEWISDYYYMFKSFVKIEDVNEIDIKGVVFHKKK